MVVCFVCNIVISYVYNCPKAPRRLLMRIKPLTMKRVDMQYVTGMCHYYQNEK